MERKASFNTVVDDYAAARPLYPEAMFDELVWLARLGNTSRTLEVGCGTGQATLPMLQRGIPVTAVELGENLAAHVRQKFAGFSMFNVVNCPFEDFAGESGYDLVFSASAFHWVGPEKGLPKVHSLLKTGGWFVMMWNNREESIKETPLGQAIDNVYSDLLPVRRNAREAITNCVTGLATSPLFTPLLRLEMPFNLIYTTTEYIRLLGTYSDHILMDPVIREELYARITRLVDELGEGRISVPYRAKAFMARSK